MLRTLLFALITLLLLELAVLVWMVHAIGWAATIGIGIVATLLGGSVARQQRARVWREWQAARSTGRAPAADAIDPILVVGSGALLMFPGFLTDVLGLVLLLPPARRAVGRWLWPMLQRRFGAVLQSLGAPHMPAPHAPSGAPRSARGGTPYPEARGGSVIDTEGEAVPGSDDPRAPPQLH